MSEKIHPLRKYMRPQVKKTAPQPVDKAGINHMQGDIQGMKRRRRKPEGLNHEKINQHEQRTPVKPG